MTTENKYPWPSPDQKRKIAQREVARRLAEYDRLQDINADLLAALEAITDRFEEALCATHATRTDRQEIKEARAAIAKARSNG